MITAGLMHSENMEFKKKSREEQVKLEGHENADLAGYILYAAADVVDSLTAWFIDFSKQIASRQIWIFIIRNQSLGDEYCAQFEEGDGAVVNDVVVVTVAQT